jgi:hypothetical protein
MIVDSAQRSGLTAELASYFIISRDYYPFKKALNSFLIKNIKMIFLIILIC